MAVLLRQALDSGAPPSMARLPMTPQEVAAACDAAGAAEAARRWGRRAALVRPNPARGARPDGAVDGRRSQPTKIKHVVGAAQRGSR